MRAVHVRSTRRKVLDGNRRQRQIPVNTDREPGTDMGLSLQVGAEEDWDWDVYKALSTALAEAGLPPHVEPRELPDDLTFSCQMWGYSGLHYLRRLAAYLGQGIEVPDPATAIPATTPCSRRTTTRWPRATGTWCCTATARGTTYRWTSKKSSFPATT